MSFNKLFLGINGEIESLIGMVVTDIKYLYNNLYEKENIVSIWLRTDSDKWLKITIDGKNCGIDEYEFDESACNLPENISIVDYSNWIRGSAIVSAQVKNTELPKITLTINLNTDKKVTFTCNHDKNCSIKFLNSDS